MSKKLITVLGVTGSQGGSAAERFLPHANWRVRGITRNPDSTKAKEWAKKGVEMVKADLDDIASLKTAFQGTHAIFAVTDWASSVSRVSEDKALQEKASAAGRSFEEYAGDLEMQQGINVATAACDPSVLSTLEKFVFSTLSAVKRISGGKFKHAYEFDSKAAAEQYMREQLPELNSRLSTINMGIFQETWKDIPAFRPHKLSNGTFEYVQLKASGSPLAYPEVVARRDTGVFVEALVLHHPAGTDVMGAAEIVTRGEYAAIWGRTMGVETRVRDVSEEEYAEYLPEGYKVGMLDMFLFFADHGYAGGNPKVKTPAELGIKTASLEEFIRGEDWSAVLKGEM